MPCKYVIFFLALVMIVVIHYMCGCRKPLDDVESNDIVSTRSGLITFQVGKADDCLPGLEGLVIVNPELVLLLQAYGRLFGVFYFLSFLKATYWLALHFLPGFRMYLFPNLCTYYSAWRGPKSHHLVECQSPSNMCGSVEQFRYLIKC